MFLKQQIRNDLNFALKKKEETTVMTLRMLNAAILNKEKAKRSKIAKEKELSGKELTEKSQLTEKELIEAVFSEVKKRKESILEYKKWGREDSARKEKKEIEVLKKYLPEQLPEKEIKKLAEEVIGAVGAKEIKDMGKVMAELMPKVKGKAEGSLVSKIVKELLTPAK